jgi:glycosyltransferase involved in cell wall biosynthesis
MPRQRFAIAQVTPYPWDEQNDVNAFVRAVSDELAQRGHEVLAVSPSQPSAKLERLLLETPLDFVHVHEPFAPSVASAALRHSRALNVGSFHAPTEHSISTQLARRVVELFFGRLDARTAAWPATRELMRRYFPAEYALLRPGADPPAAAKRGPGKGAPVRIAFLAEEERAAQRLFLRALRRLPLEPEWSARIWMPGAPRPAGAALRQELRERIVACDEGDLSEEQALAEADVVVCASLGALPAPGLILRAQAAGAVPLVARLPVYDDALGGRDSALLFEPGDVETLTAQLARLVAEPELRQRLAAAAAPRSWSDVTDELEELYYRVAARRHDAGGNGRVRSRLAKRPLIDVDLHMHTDHSGDCATPVEALLGTAKAKGLGAIAVTDHNEISGALDAREKADGIKVIVGEEVKTADQGEVIGLFIEEKIARGMTLQETIAEIKRQGGLVYVPHPFDRLHAVPDYPHLLDVLEDVDAIEVFNPRVAISSFNEEAVRFADKYQIVCGAGSDAHVTAGLGSVRIRMRDFEGPEEFLESLRDADIIRKRQSLLYVQALKFIQTKSPSGRKSTGSGNK